MSLRDGGQPDKPAIMVLSASCSSVESEVLAGIEEEGIPAVVERPDKALDAEALAIEAAFRSSLRVGVGIDSSGRVCVQHEKLPHVVQDLLYADMTVGARARIAGHNAARIVVGIPLRL